MVKNIEVSLIKNVRGLSSLIFLLSLINFRSDLFRQDEIEPTIECK